MIREAVFVFVLVCATAQGFQQGIVPFVVDANQQQQQNPNPAQPNAPQIFSAQLHFQNPNLSPHVRNWLQGMGQWRNRLGQGAINGLRQLQQFQQIQAHNLRHFMMLHRPAQNFYDGCGVSISHCDWLPKPKPTKSKVMSKLSKTYNKEEEEEEVETEKHQLERFCTEIKTVCVGNTENCVTNKDCDMALRITDRSVESKSGEKETKVIAISTLDMCQWDDLSVEDNSKQSQRYYGLGFAAYDDNQQLNCRALKTSDFKLIFLQKNGQTKNKGESQRMCEHKAENDTREVIHHHLVREIETWPTLCESLQGHKEDGAFNLKSFLKNHVTVSKYTSFFSPPFDFADNFEYEISSSGMLITGSAIAKE